VTGQVNSQLVLNIVPVSLSSDTIRVGRLIDPGVDELRHLREQHWQTHVFRYDARTREILNVTVAPNVEPIGRPDVVNVGDHQLLVARAIQHAILVWIAGKLPVLRANKDLVFWGQADEALLLSKAVQKAQAAMTAGVEVPLRYEIDCRIFRDANERPFLGLLADVSTANVLDVPVAELIRHGMVVTDRYIVRRPEGEHAYLKPGLVPLGRIERVSEGRLSLSDTVGPDEVAASDVLLEPTLVNLHDAIRALYKAKSPQILAELHQLRLPVASAHGKLARVNSTITTLRKRRLRIAGNVEITFGDVLREGHEFFPGRISTDRPPLLFGPQGSNVGTVPNEGIRTWGPYLYMQHTRNEPVIGVICEAALRGRVEVFVESLCNGFPDESWPDENTENPFRGGLIGKYRLSKIRLEYEEVAGRLAADYKAAARRLLERLAEKAPDLVMIQTREGFKRLSGNADPYLVTKAELMKAGVPSQAISIEHMDAPPLQLPYVLDNVALASYAKLDGTPWVISTRAPSTHELVVGVGYTEVAESRLGTRERYVGITTVFQGDGRYLLWGLTREVAYEDYTAELLRNLQAVVRYVRMQNGWEEGDKVRLICHVYKSLRNTEVEAIKTLVKQLIGERFTVEFAFLDISWGHPYRILDLAQPGVPYKRNGRRTVKGRGIPSRGLCLQLDRWRALLHLTGPRDVKTDEQGLPQPLLLELHRDSDFTDMTYLARQVYHFTYMSWRTFSPASEPVTVKYSQMIAQLQGKLRRIKGWDSTTLSVGSLRGRRWFL
jgi:hypothetical protein